MIVDVTNEIFDIFRRRGINLRPGLYNFTGAVEIETPVMLTADSAFLHDITIGAFSYSLSRFRNLAKVGRYCSIARDVTFGEAEHPTSRLSTSSFTYDPGFIWGRFSAEQGGAFAPVPIPGLITPPIEIGNDVWIGARAYIRAGVKIGDGAVIGANTVVTKDVPPYAVVVGNPGKIVRYRFDEDMVQRLLDCRWWSYAYTDFAGMPFEEPAQFVPQLEEKISLGTIAPFTPSRTNLTQELSRALQPAAVAM